VIYRANGSQIDSLEVALNLVQAAITKAEDPPCILLTTPGCQLSDVGEQQTPEHAGIWGFARSVRLEYPELRVCCIDCYGNMESAAGTLATALSSEDELCLQRNSTLSARLVRSSATPTRPLHLHMARRGSLMNLKALPQVERKQPGPQEVEVRVKAVGLNFRDVLNVMGLYPGDPGPPGLYCSGVVVKLGESAREFDLRCGSSAFGIVWGCFCTYATTSGFRVVPQPKTWSAAAAAALPTVYTTVDVAFAELAKLKKGERVLIHAATGGVVLVAVQYAHRLGAEVYATAGREEKREHLRSLGVKFITISRSGEQFEEDMKKFLGTKGVDVVLNSLSHDDFIGRSLRLLKKGGRFVEIGKRDVWTHDQVKQERSDIDYHLLAIDAICENEPQRYHNLLSRLAKELSSGSWEPLPMHTFEGLEQGVEALQFLQRAQHIGKVVLSVPFRMGLKADAAYVLSGGMGALGIMTAHAMAEEGAENLVLLSRSGKPAGEVLGSWEWLQASGLQVVSRKCDVGSLPDVEEMMGHLKTAVKSPVAGVLHLAGILDDAMIPQLTRSHFERVYSPKVFAANHLHKATASMPLDFFALYSSTAAMLGAAGQANYAAANSCLDALARHWGRTAVSVQWGPWLSVHGST